MSRSHLPAGQTAQGQIGGGPSNIDMANGQGGGGSRRRPPPQYMPQYQQQPMPPMYANYMPYAPQPYYGMPAQYQNGAMPGPGYMHYQNYSRSPPAMHQYVPMVGVSAPQQFSRHGQQSPVLATAYQPPPALIPMPPQTPSSSHSSQMMPPPTPPTPPSKELPPPPVQAPQAQPVVRVAPRQPFHPPLPWLSRPDVDFPARAARSRRRKKLLNADSAAVSLPTEQHGVATESNQQNLSLPHSSAAGNESLQSMDAVPLSQSLSLNLTASLEAHPASHLTSDPHSALSTNAGSVAPSKVAVPSRVNGPAVPVVPVFPKPSAKARATENTQGEVAQPPSSVAEEAAHDSEAPESNTAGELAADPVQPLPRAPPSSWAGLFSHSASGAAPGQTGQNGSIGGAEGLNGSDVNTHGSGHMSGLGFSKANTSSLAEAIQAYRVASSDRICFLEPRGLINTGNMCYMNSVLQVLMFCVPFWDFLDLVSKRAAHSFKSETPLIDAMVMFMHEYKVIRSASSIEQLRRSLKPEELEKYGEPFTPEFVYEAIRHVPRFDSMRRGHQQDAEEFLGFLLQSLDDECTQVMNSASTNSAETLSQASVSGDGSGDASGDWLEVGRKQRAAITRSSGSNSSSPLTKIFGGLLRSEFRVPGLKDSITTEPYQPLQLDIGSPDVRNVVDALRGLTRPERLQGDFNSPRGKDVMATKQVFIESLPPVLILHLKRFQFDAEGHGTVKIWKKVGYPLELEIPREALSRQKRQTIGEGGMPKYRLISVVYHHGKNASGGHYTVDVRRQEGQEWIRLDDTVLRRVRSEDVAEPGSDEEPKENRKDNSTRSANTSANRFGAMDDETIPGEDEDDNEGWKQVTAPTGGGGKRWSSVVNGSGSVSPKSKQTKENIKENKVAYILFYQRV